MTEGGTRLKGAGYYIRLLERRNPRNIGYDLYSHRKVDTRLVIRLVKESDCTFDRELVEADFTKSLQDCLRHASVGLELKCSYANNRGMIISISVCQEFFKEFSGCISHSGLRQGKAGGAIYIKFCSKPQQTHNFSYIFFFH